MMLTPSIKYILRDLMIKYKYPILFVSFFLVYYSYFVVSRNKLENDLYNLYYANFSTEFLLMVIAPIFIFWIIDHLSFYDNIKLLLKFIMLKKWWLEKSKVLFIFILIYVSLINLIFILSLIINGFILSLTFQFIKFLLLGFLLQIIGFLIIGFLYLTLKYMFNYKLLASILTYIILLIPFLINGLFYKKVYNLLDFMFLMDVTNINYFSVFFYCVSIVVLFVILNIFIIKKKDFYWGI